MYGLFLLPFTTDRKFEEMAEIFLLQCGFIYVWIHHGKNKAEADRNCSEQNHRRAIQVIHKNLADPFRCLSQLKLIQIFLNIVLIIIEIQVGLLMAT